VICLDEMGPEAAKSHPGCQVIRPDPTGDRRVWAAQEIDYGRRGKGYIFGAFRPVTGEALTAPYPSRSAANWVAFLEEAEAWVPADVGRVYAIVDNLNASIHLRALLTDLFLIDEITRPQLLRSNPS
jgi:hypothetical protein